MGHTLRGQQLHDVRVEVDEQLVGVRRQPGLPTEQLHDAGQRAAGDADGAAPGLRTCTWQAICHGAGAAAASITPDQHIPQVAVHVVKKCLNFPTYSSFIPKSHVDI